MHIVDPVSRSIVDVHFQYGVTDASGVARDEDSAGQVRCRLPAASWLDRIWGLARRGAIMRVPITRFERQRNELVRSCTTLLLCKPLVPAAVQASRRRLDVGPLGTGRANV